MATHCSRLAWKIPWTEEPGGLTVHRVVQSWIRLSTHMAYLVFHEFIFLVTPCSLQDSPTRDQTHAPCSGNSVLPTGPPGNFPI